MVQASSMVRVPLVGGGGTVKSSHLLSASIDKRFFGALVRYKNTITGKTHKKWQVFDSDRFSRFWIFPNTSNMVAGIDVKLSVTYLASISAFRQNSQKGAHILDIVHSTA